MTGTRYFRATNAQGGDYGIWRMTKTFAIRFKEGSVARKPPDFFDVLPGDTFETAFLRLHDGPNVLPFILQELGTIPGAVFRRIARPTYDLPSAILHNTSGAYSTELAMSAGQLAALTDRLDAICGVVHPKGANLHAFGHEIRSLLILACTEVEAQWKAILAANRYQPGKNRQSDRWNTSDYVKLKQVLRLGEYRARPTHFPWMRELDPFSNWNTSTNTTKSLAWYDAYNAVKHDREANFAEGTLHRAFEAVAACHIMYVSQGGYPRGTPYFTLTRPLFAPEEHYFRPAGSSAPWKLALYKF